MSSTLTLLHSLIYSEPLLWFLLGHMRLFRPFQINLYFLVLHFLPNHVHVGSRVIKTIVLVYALCSRSGFHQKVHLLLDDITVVSAEGNERCWGDPRMHRILFRFLELHNSHFLHESSWK